MMVENYLLQGYKIKGTIIHNLSQVSISYLRGATREIETTYIPKVLNSLSIGYMARGQSRGPKLKTAPFLNQNNENNATSLEISVTRTQRLM